MDARTRILARRARFLAATLAACSPTASTPPRTTTPPSASTPPRATSSVAADADQDGIPDADDRCPRQPGATSPWRPEAHGCPCLSIVTPSKIVIVQRVFFAADSAIVQASSEPLLTEIALLLAEHPEIASLRLVGFREAKEPSAISAARADAVRAWLEAHGVAPGRLAVEDGGVSAGEGDAARERRVGFVVP